MSDWTALHLFCGLGGGALGFQRAGFRCVGAIDNNREALEDLENLTGVEGTHGDLSEMLPADIRDAAGERPDVVFTSPPCKSFSGCLPADRAETDEYRELSSLAQRGIWLVLEAWDDQPPPLIVMENVPRIQSRGEEWLEETVGMLRSYGYAISETTHDCGRIGHLAQRRKRYLMVARHTEQVGEFLYEPPKHEHKSIGAVIDQLPVPLPGSDAGGPMHRLTRLSPLNWLRLAAIPAGGDWRDLPDQVDINSSPRSTVFGVSGWKESSGTVVGHASHDNGPFSVADPRVSERRGRHNGGYGTNDWWSPAHSVVAEGSIQNTWASVVDPRVTCDRREGSLGVQGWRTHSASIIGSIRVHNWPLATADPRIDHSPRDDSWGVLSRDHVSRTIRGVQKYTNGASTVADPRHASITHTLTEDGGLTLHGPPLDLESKRPADPIPIILAPDGTWHRPLTTLELAALQGFPTKIDGDWLSLSGGSKARWRERIGNAVPPPAAEAIARTCAETLEAAEGDDFLMRGTPVWVDPGEVLHA